MIYVLFKGERSVRTRRRGFGVVASQRNSINFKEECHETFTKNKIICWHNIYVITKQFCAKRTELGCDVGLQVNKSKSDSVDSRPMICDKDAWRQIRELCTICPSLNFAYFDPARPETVADYQQVLVCAACNMQALKRDSKYNLRR